MKCSYVSFEYIYYIIFSLMSKISLSQSIIHFLLLQKNRWNIVVNYSLFYKNALHTSSTYKTVFIMHSISAISRNSLWVLYPCYVLQLYDSLTQKFATSFPESFPQAVLMSSIVKVVFSQSIRKNRCKFFPNSVLSLIKETLIVVIIYLYKNKISELA